MDKLEKKDRKSNTDQARRKLLKLGIYSVPAVVFLGRATGARASGQVVRGKDDDKDCSLFEKIITLWKCDD